MGEILSFISAKGGTGKTTAAVLTAAYLSSPERKVLVMDLNAGSGAVPELLNLSGKIVYHLADVLEGNCKIIQAFLHPEAFPDLYVLPAPLNRDQTALNPVRLLKLLTLFKEQFDFIILDVPTGENAYTRGLREITDRWILVSGVDKLSMISGENYVRKMTVNCKARLYVILDRIRRDLLRAECVAGPEEVLNALKAPLLGIVAEEDEIYMLPEKAAKISLLKSYAGREFRNIANRILGKEIPFELK